MDKEIKSKNDTIKELKAKIDNLLKNREEVVKKFNSEIERISNE